MGWQGLKQVAVHVMPIASLAILAGCTGLSPSRARAAAVQGRLSDGTHTMTEGIPPAAEWNGSHATHFGKTGVLRVAWDKEHLRGMLSEDLPARKVGTVGDLLVAKIRFDDREIHVYFHEQMTDTRAMLWASDAVVLVRNWLVSGGVRSVKGFDWKAYFAPGGPPFHCATEFSIPLASLGVGRQDIRKLSLSVERVRNPVLRGEQQTG